MNGSFVPVVEGKYHGPCDKGPLHSKWVEAPEFRFHVKYVDALGTPGSGLYVYQFGVWVWQGGCWPMKKE